MKIQAYDPEEEYQVFLREYKLDTSTIKIGYDAHALCDHYFRLLLGFSDVRKSRRETDCFFFLPMQLDELAVYAVKAGLKLSSGCFFGIHFLKSTFPVQKQPVRTALLSETEAMLCFDTVNEVRNAVLSLLPSNWKEPQELTVESALPKAAFTELSTFEENNSDQSRMPVLEYIDSCLGRVPDELLAARAAAHYDLDKKIALDLCAHMRNLNHRNLK